MTYDVMCCVFDAVTLRCNCATVSTVYGGHVLCVNVLRSVLYMVSICSVFDAVLRCYCARACIVDTVNQMLLLSASQIVSSGIKGSLSLVRKLGKKKRCQLSNRDRVFVFDFCLY